MNDELPAAPDFFEAAMAQAQASAMSLLDLIGRAETLKAAGRADASIALYRQWIASLSEQQLPLVFVAQFNLGVLLGAKADHVGAEAAYRAAIAVNPKLFEAWFNLGSQLESLKRPDEALDCWQSVVDHPELDLNEHRSLLVQLLNRHGRLAEIEHRYPLAEASLRRSLELDPHQPNALQHWIQLRHRQCIWPVNQAFGEVTGNAMILATSPLTMLNAQDDPALQLLAANLFLDRKLQKPRANLAAGRSYAHQRLRIGYLSGDLCTHAVGLLLADLFEHHDRQRVEVYAFCSSIEDQTAYRERLKASFEHFERIVDLSDEQAAQRILDCEIDLLIDMHGPSAGARQGILALRPAPVQATWLGFIGTSGLPWIDYVIADRFALPQALQPMYSEQILYLEPCFLPGDRKREVGAAVTRAQAGLPEDSFIFASFNNAYKMNPVMFASWMRVLQAVPGSVLWLLDDNPTATANLAAFALERGIARERLVFAPRTTIAQYRAQLPLADLFLDNHPYNAGSTANDVLWAGTPMLTLSGKTFVSRMGGSLLSALGLPELVTYNHLQYEETAIALARDPARLRALRERLHLARYQSAAFDMERLARGLEDLYQQAVEGHRPRGATPSAASGDTAEFEP